MQTIPSSATDAEAPDGARPAAEVGEDDEGAAAPPGSSGRPTQDRTRSWIVLGLLLVVLAVPLVTALGVLREPRWYPSVDDAQTEIRVRDAWSANPPLTGLGGRIGVYGPEQGSHPGPLSFYSASVFYRLFGSSTWALHAATTALSVIAMGLTLWLARRRGGFEAEPLGVPSGGTVPSRSAGHPGRARGWVHPRRSLAVLLGVAAVLVALAHAYGGYALTLPWNPYMPVLWWMVFLMGVWSLLCGDLPVLPVTVFAGSFAMQTHISYVGLVGALFGLSAVVTVFWIFVRRHDRRERRRSLMWAASGTAVGAVLWFPPVAEQITGSQGNNLTKIADHFGDPPEEPLGLSRGLDFVLANLDPWHLLTEPVIDDRFFLGGPTLPGKLLLAAWAAAVIVSWRLKHRTLMRLHLLLVLVLALGVASASRIFGPPWVYLALWGWGICAMLVIAVGWSTCALLARVAPDGARPRLAAAGVVGAVAAMVVVTAQFTVDAAYVDQFQPEISEASGELVPQTVEALEQGRIPGTGRDGRYLVTWSDPRFLGGRGFTLFNELDREGFDVGAPRFFQGAVTRHRVITPDEATAEVHLAVGSDIETWADTPGYRRIASYDPSGPAGRAEYERLRAEVTLALEAEGRSELTSLFEENPAGFRNEGGLPAELVERTDRMLELGVPVAVLVGPPVTA